VDTLRWLSIESNCSLKELNEDIGSIVIN
jgi:hypothetical protein